ncbi:CynX/NimT family MFS transporter [Paenibacillus gorillae]|uniref:MFS transporter n=1 Tax=Paenibacillus gorillae TaxID=1243662 RepID=UPI0004B06839|nr:MFS transporter [Paenibacillus gorillae]
MKKKHVGFMIIAILFVSMNLRPAITSIAALLETIQSDLSLSSTTVSLLTAIPVICMGIFAPLTTRFIQRFGLERTVTYCLVLIGAATGLRFFAENTALFLMTAGLIGIGLAIIGPSLSGYIKQHFPSHAHLMIGIYSAGIGLGASLGAGLTIPLKNQLHIGWPAALAFWLILALISIMLWIFATKGGIQSKLTSKPNRKPFPWRNKRALLVMIFFGLQGCLNYSITVWIAPISRLNHFSEALAGTVVTVFTLVQMGASIILPLFAAKFPNRLFWMLFNSIILLSGLLMLSFMNGMNVPWIAAVLLGFSSGGLFYLALLLPLDETDNAEDASSWTSMVQFGGYILSGIGPIFTGWIHNITGSYPISFIGLSIIGLFVVVLSLVIGNKKSTERRITIEDY